jgi:hypothetical protein
MHWFMISEFAGLAAILAATFFMRRRLPAFRRERARKQALAGTAVLAAVLGLGYAQMAPARGWPLRNFWAVGLFDEGANQQYCSIMATDYPDNTMQFQLVKGRHGAMARLISTKASYPINSPQISFASDGFHVLTLPALSEFSRMLDGKMGNTVAAKLDPDQWQKLWSVFRSSGVVTLDTHVVESHMPTDGFERASADFEQCFAQLEVVTDRR